mgnify:CR=1 FL=1
MTDMEDVEGQATSPGSAPSRARLVACVVVLVACAFVQLPGWTALDTKVDLYENPWAFLGRSLHAWDVHTASGTLQNQAFGYLFPQGPFFGVLHSLGLSAWLSQRLWWSLLLVVAFLGMRRLLVTIGFESDAVVLISAMAYAVSPRIVSAIWSWRRASPSSCGAASLTTIY